MPRPTPVVVPSSVRRCFQIWDRETLQDAAVHLWTHGKIADLARVRYPRKDPRWRNICALVSCLRWLARRIAAALGFGWQYYVREIKGLRGLPKRLRLEAEPKQTGAIVPAQRPAERMAA